MITIHDPNRRLSRDPRRWPQSIKDAIAECCCGGSGSGSGSGDGSGSGSGDGETNCCHCPSWPSTLEATITVSHIGTRTITLNKVVEIECNDEEVAGDNLKIQYTGIYLDSANLEFASATDCRTGAPTLVEPTPFTEKWEVNLQCVQCGAEDSSSTNNWVVNAEVNSFTSGSIKHAHYLRKISVTSCDPNTFAPVDDTIVCEDDTTEDTECSGEVGVLISNKNEPWTNYTNGVGQTFELDISA